jgi:hypothetical protein
MSLYTPPATRMDIATMATNLRRNRNVTPTPPELALIAATLKGNRKISNQALAAEAMDLFRYCAGQLRHQEVKADTYEMIQEIAQAPPPHDVPKQYPVTFEEALRLWFPRKKQPDRWKAFRDFLQWRNGIQADNAKARGQKFTAATMEDYRKKSFDRLQFLGTGQQLAGWRYQATRTARANAGRRGGIHRKPQQSNMPKRNEKSPLTE